MNLNDTVLEVNIRPPQRFKLSRTYVQVDRKRENAAPIERQRFA
jgi:hypothetical protein